MMEKPKSDPIQKSKAEEDALKALGQGMGALGCILTLLITVPLIVIVIVIMLAGH